MMIHVTPRQVIFIAVLVATFFTQQANCISIRRFTNSRNHTYSSYKLFLDIFKRNFENAFSSHIIWGGPAQKTEQKTVPAANEIPVLNIVRLTGNDDTDEEETMARVTETSAQTTNPPVLQSQQLSVGDIPILVVGEDMTTSAPASGRLTVTQATGVGPAPEVIRDNFDDSVTQPSDGPPQSVDILNSGITPTTVSTTTVSTTTVLTTTGEPEFVRDHDVTDSNGTVGNGDELIGQEPQNLINSPKDQNANPSTSGPVILDAHALSNILQGK